MNYKTLNIKHSCWDGEQCAKHEALYKAGKHFNNLISQFLLKNPTEQQQVYERRKKEAFYTGYVAEIVNSFSSNLFSSPFTVKTDKDSDNFYGYFKEDVDGAGTDFQDFMRERFKESLINKTSWWICEKEITDEPALSILEYKERGLDTYWIKSVEAHQVFDWDCHEDGQFSWIIIHDIKCSRANPRDPKVYVTETWRLYDKEFVETFQITYEQNRKPKDTDEITSLGKIQHGFDRIPIIQMDLPEGLWLVNQIAETQIQHFRLSNALSWAYKMTCYPMAIFKTDEADELKRDLKMGAGNYVIMNTADEFEWVSPQANSYSEIRSQITSLKDEMHRVASQMALAVDNTSGNAGRSGESKYQDQLATEICLKAYGSIVKEAVEKTFELISDSRGDLDIKFSVEGMNKFNIRDMDSVLATVKTAKELSIPSETFNKQLLIMAAETILPEISQELKDAVYKEIIEADLTQIQPNDQLEESVKPVDEVIK